MSGLDLPLDLDGWPYRTIEAIGPWRVSPCCGALVEWSAADGSGCGTGMDSDLLTCKRCYRAVPEGFVDSSPRLDPSAPLPVQVRYLVAVGRDGIVTIKRLAGAAG